jgi:hypothetical protein
MITEVLTRLSFLTHLHNYRYIGLGSPYFADFIQFHKNLGITNLISIEKEITKKARFDFNIPYSGIKMAYGHSETILPNLELGTKNNIIWLDFDDKISNFMFSNIDTVFFNSKPGSFFIISVNVENDLMQSMGGKEEEDYAIEEKINIADYRRGELFKRIDKSKFPSEYSEINLTTKNLTMATYEMLTRQINTALNNRNGEKPNKVHYQQVFNFVYKDNATILSFGGIIFDESQKSVVKEMEFENLSFYNNTNTSYFINSPNLTLREIKALDKLLPTDVDKNHRGKFKNTLLNELPLIQSDIIKYAKVYRYFPNFTEITL